MSAVLEKDRYRAAALETKAYVKTHLYFGASNDWKFYAKSLGLTLLFPPAGILWKDAGLYSHHLLQSATTDDATREGKAAAAAGHPYRKGTPRMAKALMDIWAKEGLHYHCGNCGVQSAVAFVHLRDYWKIFPLDWVQLRYGDHGFVVIGRDARTDPSDASTWNAEAVVCDPWRNVVRTAGDYANSRENLELIYRQASARDIPGN
ncbi:MAG: hypothetical protein HOQ10_08115 [Frateuria sp.]|uniref:hypothetical protein n=1 Tax=Frateuria sp. TaxID=2211372 RepID=UPI00183F84DE|nr:hypothetical protein [Frateuria sp.]NUO72663.1 hypothetical protein [Frateuria sp.]NUR23658.1 hypothetical protein [Frateuria sp.]